MSDSLQKAFEFGENIVLSHRVVLAPMTRMRASSDGVPAQAAIEYYSERATSGGLLISEGVVVGLRGRGFPNTPGLWTEEQVDAWKPITAAVKRKGAFFFAQLWYLLFLS
jgi:2,4-dienoyl-CoA reductase-like NADH-dependent reductase (Old Yellow Enzyme family)